MTPQAGGQIVSLADNGPTSQQNVYYEQPRKVTYRNSFSGRIPGPDEKELTVWDRYADFKNPYG
jgi:hypothetical protein